MPILDFKEIPEAHISSGLQDTFELFARDFLEFMGYKIISNPDRGADGGKDLIVNETRTGVGGETDLPENAWCLQLTNHFIFVSPQVEANIRDRVETHNCQGFIGFYSTIASTGLSTNLEGQKEKFESQVFDKEEIEKRLLSSSKGIHISKRYFPISIQKWQTENPKPAKLFVEDPSLKCMICGKELLTTNYSNLIAIWQKIDSNGKKYIKEITWSCKGHCDHQMEYKFRKNDPNYEYIDSWEDISDVMIPTTFLRWVMSTLNEHRNGVTYSDEAFENLKHFLIQIFPHVSRHLTENEKERLSSLSIIPSYLGGYGDN